MVSWTGDETVMNGGRLSTTHAWDGVQTAGDLHSLAIEQEVKHLLLTVSQA